MRGPGDPPDGAGNVVERSRARDAVRDYFLIFARPIMPLRLKRLNIAECTNKKIAEIALSVLVSVQGLLIGF